MNEVLGSLLLKAKDIVGWNFARPRLPVLVALAKRYLAWSRTVKFDVGLRYDPVVRFIRRRESQAVPFRRILDVGCGPWGLGSYLGRECVGVDPATPGPDVPTRTNWILRIRGSVTALPFPDGCFDVVTSMDTLEHLPAPARAAALREMFRVASRGVVLGVPFGPKSEAYDRWAGEWERARRVLPDWRREHVANGLPAAELEVLVRSLAASRHARRMKVRKHENLGFLRFRWRILQALPQSHPAYGLVMAPLYAAARRLHVGSCYRRLYFVEFDVPLR